MAPEQSLDPEGMLLTMLFLSLIPGQPLLDMYLWEAPDLEMK